MSNKNKREKPRDEITGKTLYDPLNKRELSPGELDEMFMPDDEEVIDCNEDDEDKDDDLEDKNYDLNYYEDDES